MSNFIVFLTPLETTRAAEYLQQHIQYFDELRANGHVIANGKLEDGSGGIAIFQASSVQEVEQLLAVDPFVALQIRKAEVKEWGAKWGTVHGQAALATAGEQQHEIAEITVGELKARIDSGDRPFLVDVREDDEVVNGIIPGAFHIRLGDLTERYQELPRDKELLFVCRGGRRSRLACEIFRDKGYTQLVNVAGGVTAWNEFSHE